MSVCKTFEALAFKVHHEDFLLLTPFCANEQDILALGAIFATTDSVAVLQVLDKDRSPILFSLVFGEGVLNDAAGVALLRAIQVCCCCALFMSGMWNKVQQNRLWHTEYRQSGMFCSIGDTGCQLVRLSAAKNDNHRLLHLHTGSHQPGVCRVMHKLPSSSCVCSCQLAVFSNRIRSRSGTDMSDALGLHKGSPCAMLTDWR